MTPDSSPRIPDRALQDYLWQQGLSPLRPLGFGMPDWEIVWVGKYVVDQAVDQALCDPLHRALSVEVRRGY